MSSECHIRFYIIHFTTQLQNRLFDSALPCQFNLCSSQYLKIVLRDYIWLFKPHQQATFIQRSRLGRGVCRNLPLKWALPRNSSPKVGTSARDLLPGSSSFSTLKRSSQEHRGVADLHLFLETALGKSFSTRIISNARIILWLIGIYTDYLINRP